MAALFDMGHEERNHHVPEPIMKPGTGAIMRAWLIAASLLSVACLSIGCGEEESKCEAPCNDGEGGAAGADGGEAGTGGGEAGTGGGEAGTGGGDDTSWSEERPDTCGDEEASRVFNTNLFHDVVNVHVSPRLEPGFSEKATVTGLEENMTVVSLRTDGGSTVRITWPGVVTNHPVDSKVTLSQTRDWTILTRADGSFSAMYKRNGAIPTEELSPLPGGKLALRFAMQCNLSDQNSCTLDAVALHSADGDEFQIFESGTITHVDDWVVSNRSAKQTSGCQGNVEFRSLIWVEGKP